MKPSMPELCAFLSNCSEGDSAPSQLIARCTPLPRKLSAERFRLVPLPGVSPVSGGATGSNDAIRANMELLIRSWGSPYAFAQRVTVFAGTAIYFRAPFQQ